jgi:hypothetical protein
VSVPNRSHFQREANKTSISIFLIRQTEIDCEKRLTVLVSSRSDRRGIYSSTGSNANYCGWVSFSA